MPKIQILTDHVANQIAAGEVIERPVAVIKELVENSLDANATIIEIEIKNGGKNYIKVEDNGCGMSQEDALLCLERHATSKIRHVDDLNTVYSFGFRGEAIPSIASVSKFTLLTRCKESQQGVEIFVNGGKFIHRKDCGMPVGTKIEVAHLFNSVPVRRKFLKTDNTEAAHISYLARILAISNPDVSFTLLDNGRIRFKSPECPSLLDRIREIFGNQISDQIIWLEAEEGGLKLSGYIGKPGVGRSTKQEMITFVNKRPVDSRTLNYSIIESYHTFLPKGRYPLAFLFLSIPANGIDINVHPAKREVRFRDEGNVRQFVMQTLINKLVEESKPKISAVKKNDENSTHNLAFQHDTKKLNLSSLATIKTLPTQVITSGDNKIHFTDRTNDISGRINKKNLDNEIKKSKNDGRSQNKNLRLDWRFIGVTFDQYIIFEVTTGLILLNQDAANERIFFEEIKSNLDKDAQAHQLLLFPVPLELDPIATNILNDNMEFFEQNGFNIEPFGRNFFRMLTIPNWLNADLGEIFIKDIISLIKENGIQPSSSNLTYELIAKIAVKRMKHISIMTNESDCIKLAERLMNCNNPMTDPRGRPILIEFKQNDINKKFGK